MIMCDIYISVTIVRACPMPVDIWIGVYYQQHGRLISKEDRGGYDFFLLHFSCYCIVTYYVDLRHSLFLMGGSVAERVALAMMRGTTDVDLYWVSLVSAFVATKFWRHLE
jgi:hypothetical protein